MKTQQIKDNLNKELPKTQKQILNFVNHYGSVVQRILFINCKSKSNSTLEKHVRKLEDKNFVETERNSKVKSKKINITEKGRRKVES